ncbi:MAG: hypothetical protein Q9219_002402 [cf. Caloplaca sp. 3 TL-2023]
MSSIATSRDPAAAEATSNGTPGLEEHLVTLGAPTVPSEVDYMVDKKVAAGHAIRQSLLDQPGTKDIFRHMGGFETLLKNLNTLADVIKHDQSSSKPLKASMQMLWMVFSILAAALAHHRGNRIYFRDRIARGGWDLLNLKLDGLLQAFTPDDYEASAILARHVFGCLFTCALDDETVLELFQEKQLKQNAAESTSQNADRAETEDPDSIAAAQEDLAPKLGPAPFLQNPEALCVALQLWHNWQITAESKPGQVRDTKIVQALLHLAVSKAHNLVALHQTNLLSILILYIVDVESNQRDISGVCELAALLLTLGITKLDDAHKLYLHARNSSIVANLLLRALSSSHSPSSFHFDLSLHGYSSIELPDLGVSFPPTNLSSGYTLSLWFQVGQFDSNAHTTLFGAFDSSQTCFVLVYLEKDSHNLILQTSVTSSKPSVRFRSIAFREGRWYHVAIAHQKPRTTSSSRVSLFVNGSFVEQLKANYPMTSPVSKTKAGNTDHDPANLRPNPVQAFVGTPQDLASRLGKGVISTEWRLASAHLFGDVLSDDLLAVHYELGPRYYGNYQDCLGSFNTYQAAASLKLRNDSLYPGKEQRSNIILAMETGGSELLPEKKVMLGVCPEYAFSASQFAAADGPHFLGFTSKAATKAARNLIPKGHDSLAINSAMPIINHALSHPHGYALLTGDPAVIAVRFLDSSAWQIGGCTAVVLDQLDKANSDNAVLCSLNCVFESIKDNWRSSEAMERDHGFAILSSLIGQKITVENTSENTGTQSNSGDEFVHQAEKKPKPELMLQILTIVLKFLGFRTDKPEHSVLNNPLAYRVLLVDADYWRKTPLDVQQLYYEQFAVFGTRSKYRSFNIKRLSKMRIIKKWLEALKTDTFNSNTSKFFLSAFHSVLSMNTTGDNLRSLAMYITYALEKAQNEGKIHQERSSIRVRDRSPVQPTDPQDLTSTGFLKDGSEAEHSTGQIAVSMLELYANFVCRQGDIGNIMKFAKTVTNKVRSAIEVWIVVNI